MSPLGLAAALPAIKVGSQSISVKEFGCHHRVEKPALLAVSLAVPLPLPLSLLPPLLLPLLLPVVVPLQLAMQLALHLPLPFHLHHKALLFVTPVPLPPIHNVLTPKQVNAGLVASSSLSSLSPIQSPLMSQLLKCEGFV